MIPVICYITIRNAKTELILTERETNRRYRLRPLDPGRMDLVDEQKRITIPLKKG